MNRLAHYLIAMILLFEAQTGFASCEETSDSPLNYVPTVVTAPVSLAFSGVGYTIDGLLYISVPVALSGLVCLPISAVIDGSSGSRCFSELLTRGNFSGLPVIDTDLGPETFAGTVSWRCPFNIN
jgi:hypothetical protein